MPTSKLMRVRVMVFMKIMADGAAGEHGVRLTALLRGLELGGQVEQRPHLGRREVVDGQEAAAGEVQLGDTGLQLCGHAAPSVVRCRMGVCSCAAGEQPRTERRAPAALGRRASS